MMMMMMIPSSSWDSLWWDRGSKWVPTEFKSSAVELN